MKSFIASLLAAGAVATTWEQDVEIAGGVFYGLTGADNLEELHTCMTDADIFAMELVHAFKLITEFNDDKRSYISAYRLIVNAVSDFPSYITTCESTGSDWSALGDWFTIFIHPINLVKRVSANLIGDFPEVVKHTIKAHGHLKREEFFNFGNEVGTVVGILTQPVNEDLYTATVNPNIIIQ